MEVTMDRNEESWSVFYGFRCHGCDEPLLLAFDHYESKMQLRFEGTSRFPITCVRCGDRDFYGREDFRRFEVVPDGLAATPWIAERPLTHHA
jgi:hypothetical protein